MTASSPGSPPSSACSASLSAMRIAFYAPLKAPDHPVVSGDRQIARLLLRALRLAGHDVRIVSRWRSYRATGNPARQTRQRRRGGAIAARLLSRSFRRWKPQLWFTYHLYHKAPDWLGPPVSAALGIPYALAEVSFAPKRATGPWATGHAAVADAIGAADTIFFLNPIDRECVVPLLRRGARAAGLRPFLDSAGFRRAAGRRERHRASLARAHRIEAEEPWLLAVGMMRPGDKLASYRQLAAALTHLKTKRWRLLIAGGGPAQAEVRRAFAGFKGRVHWLGALSAAQLAPVYAASDLLVWPAVNEAIGLAVLEAQAAGLPAVVGRAGALDGIVADGKTGVLVAPGDTRAFAAAIAGLLADAGRRRAFGKAALAKTRRLHDLAAAAKTLDRELRAALRRFARRRVRR